MNQPAPAPRARQISRQTPPPRAAAAPKAENQNAPDPMSLSTVVPTRRQVPIRVCLYGIGGIGKTTAAAEMGKNVIFMAMEDGQFKVNAEKWPHRPQTFAEVLRGIRNLTFDQNGFDTLVIDTLDEIEHLIGDVVCAEIPKENGSRAKNIEDYGFQAGYKHALSYWRKLFVALEQLQAKRGMHVVLIAHEQLRSVKHPEQNDYERYEPSLDRRAVGLLHGWVHDMLFATRIVHTAKLQDTKLSRYKGISDGVHYFRTSEQAGHLAKSRTPLPDPLEVNGRMLFQLLTSDQDSPALCDDLVAEIRRLADSDCVPDDKRAAAYALADRHEHAGNAAMLEQIRNRLAAYVAHNSIADEEPAEAAETPDTETEQ